MQLFKMLMVLVPLVGALFPGMMLDQYNAVRTAAGSPDQGGFYQPPTEPGGYTARIGATRQSFDNGFMTWRADNGLIWVFLQTGQVYAFPLETYAHLPNTAVYPQRPYGRTLPGQGFKRVYDNFPEIRAALGWGVGGESGFLMQFLVDYQQNVYITPGSDVSICIAPDGTWREIDAFPSLPDAPPQPTIVSFTVSPAVIDREETIHLTWNVQDAASVDVYRDARGVPVKLGNFPAVGSLDYAALSTDVYEIGFSVIPVDSMGRPNQDVWQAQTVSIRCPFVYFFGTTSLLDVAESCPMDGVESAPGAFQPFENGMMVWRSDTHEILVLFDSGQFWPYADSWVEGEPDAVTGTPPAGRIAPVRGFGKIWAAENAGSGADSLRQSLGWATAVEQSYSMQVQTISFANRYRSGYALALPDGRAIFLDTQFRTWQVIAP